LEKHIPPTPLPPNMLCDLHAQLVSVTTEFRKFICEECNWSIPTFYRKIRTADKHTVDSKSIPALSNAEKEKITEVYDILVRHLWEYSGKYRK
jgi:hypothetical protein